MIGADIKKGDTLLLMYSDFYEDGDVVVARINGKLHIRCYNDDGEGNIWLVPKNEKYQSKPFPDFINGIIASGGLVQYTKERAGN